MRRRFRWRVGTLLFALCVALPLASQTTETALGDRLGEKPLYLRGFWGDGELQFDSAGHLASGSNTVSFTVSGFELRSIHLDRRMLTLKGRRMGLEFVDGKPVRVALLAVRKKKGDVPIEIEIATPANGDFGPALDAIFSDGLAGLVPSLPAYWQTYARANFLPKSAHAGVMIGNASSWVGSPKKGGVFVPPMLVRRYDAQYSDAALNLRYGGNMSVAVVIAADGSVQPSAIVKPVGLGLDEAAITAVQGWVFEPATSDGTPVPHAMQVQYSFQVRGANGH